MSEGTHKVLVLGAAGMLGHVLFRFLANSPGLDVVGTVRDGAVLSQFSVELRDHLRTGVEATDSAALEAILDASAPDVVINCIGLIKQRPEGQDYESAIAVNALLPHRIARLTATAGARLIHLSTDCVFDGAIGNYSEDSRPNCEDVYGRSKLLGEIAYGNAVTLRTSIIGPELTGHLGLLDWFLRQSGPVKGYRKAIFSGVPTVELARIIRDFVLPAVDLRGLFHVSAAPISKYDLLKLVQELYDTPATLVADDELVVDRSLNSGLFRGRTNYAPPDWPVLLKSMKAFG